MKPIKNRKEYDKAVVKLMRLRLSGGSDLEAEELEDLMADYEQKNSCSDCHELKNDCTCEED